MQWIKRFIQKYLFAEELPLEARMLNMVLLVFVMATSLNTLSRMIMGAAVMGLIIVLLIIILSLIGMFIICNKYRLYHACTMSLVFLTSFVLFPVGFFFFGGVGGTMTGYFAFCMIMIFLFLRGKVCAAAAISHVAAVCLIYYINWLHPELSVTLSGGAEHLQHILYLDRIVSYLILGFGLSMIVRCQGMILDMARRRADDAVAEAQAANRAKSDFLSNMSHEIRTPMNAIIGMTAIGKGSGDPVRKDYAFGKIDDASTHLLGVINDILDMSKIESGKFELSDIEYSFEKMLQKVVNVVNYRVEEKSQQFIVRIDKNIPNMLIGDDQRLAQIITNLLSNAVKFTPEGGIIRLNADLIEEDEHIVSLKIAVTDSGIGISADQQARLFQSFQQAESGTTRKFGGTGLGLAISKSIVEMMGGKIWIESELGHGATFAFTLRAMRGAATETHAHLSVSWGSIRVLAVDDMPEIRDYFADIAARLGFKCDVASGGKEALEMLAQNGAYDIYFIDWKMPDMDGFELTRRIKAGGDASLVTMISAAEWGTMESEARAVGVDNFLPKPLFPSSIADTITKCLGMENLLPKDDDIGQEIRSFAGAHILLAEDVEINREIVLTLLEPTQLEIDCAENGAEALRMFRDAQDRYDVILMDIQMPEMDGYEATRQIRALNTPRAAQVPIIAMTANVFREDIERCLECGMTDHVGKPLDFEEVLEKLEKYLYFE